MNTTLATHPTLPAQPIFHRFLWKEYRMLRGFWLAVGVLAVIVQFVLPHIQYDARQVPAQLFTIAWGASALYAVGAAITLFSAEREERTHDFLRVLPDRWLPMFAGKVLLAMLSAVALAVVLSLTGWLLAGNSWPSEAARRETLAVVGVAIVEATAWGLLFSLWMKQPLLAAILSMAAASLGAQLAVVVASPNDAMAYSQAESTRLLVCFGVFLIDIWLASRWLHPAPSTRLLKRRHTPNSLAIREVAVGTSVATRPRRRRILASLLWQTWRESWATMLVAVPIALLLMIAIFMAAWLSKTEAIAAFLCPLLLPALFGALVFRADQRRSHRQFLVTHAGRPCYVWLARHVVWLTSLIVMGWVLNFVTIWMVKTGMQQNLRHQFRNLHMYGHSPTAWSTVSELQMEVSMFWNVLNVGGCALLAAYGIGQLCSMLLSREVLAGFLALLLAAVLTAWAFVVGVWELNPFWFVLSIGVVTLAATWLRAPDWIVGRNSPRAWLAPALPLVLPLGLIVMMLPSIRIFQVANPPTWQIHKYLQEPLEDSLRDFEASGVHARETATAYEQLFTTLNPLGELAKEVRVDGMNSNELMEEFSKEAESDEGVEENVVGEYGGEYGGGGYGEMGGEYGGGYGKKMGGYDNNPLTQEQQELLDRYERAAFDAYTTANQKVIAELVSLSQQGAALVSYRLGDKIEQLKQLLLEDAIRLEADDQLPEAFARLLTFARINGQLLSHQQTKTAVNYFQGIASFRPLNEAIYRWAQHPAQTSKKLKAAIVDLQAVYASYPELRETILADHLSIRDVLLEKEPPSFFKEKNKKWTNYLPYMANKFSWERERALRALDILTGLRLNSIDKPSFLLAEGTIQGDTYRNRFRFAEWFQSPNPESVQIVNESVYENDWDAYAAAQKYHHLCNTSYLLAEEMSHRVDTSRVMVIVFNDGVDRRGLLLQLALIAYRLDHEEYPENLEELAPDYLVEVPLDPYSQAPFEYRAEGLDLPLHTPELAPNTPLLWSVGVMQLLMGKQNADYNAYRSSMGEEYGLPGSYGGEYGNEFGDEGEVSDEMLEKNPEPEMVYVFRSSNRRWGNLSNLVFPLPVQKDSSNSN